MQAAIAVSNAILDSVRQAFPHDGFYKVSVHPVHLVGYNWFVNIPTKNDSTTASRKMSIHVAPVSYMGKQGLPAQVLICACIKNYKDIITYDLYQAEGQIFRTDHNAHEGIDITMHTQVVIPGIRELKILNCNFSTRDLDRYYKAFYDIHNDEITVHFDIEDAAIIPTIIRNLAQVAWKVREPEAAAALVTDSDSDNG